MEASRYREALDKTLDIEGEYRVFTGLIHLPIHPSICLSMYVYIYLRICLFSYICIYSYLSICVSIYILIEAIDTTLDITCKYRVFTGYLYTLNPTPYTLNPTSSTL